MRWSWPGLEPQGADASAPGSEEAEGLLENRINHAGASGSRRKILRSRGLGFSGQKAQSISELKALMNDISPDSRRNCDWVRSKCHGPVELGEAEVDVLDIVARGTQPKRQRGFEEICLVTTKDICEGELVLMEEQPISRIVEVRDLKSGLCLWCGSDKHHSWICKEFLSAYPSPVTENTDCLVLELAECFHVDVTDRLPQLLVHVVILMNSRDRQVAQYQAQAINSLIKVFGDPSVFQSEAEAVLNHALLYEVLPPFLRDQTRLSSLAFVLTLFEVEERVQPCVSIHKTMRYAVFALSSFCRHSCMPNVELCMQDGKLTLFALEPIKQGHAVCIDYCGNAALRPASERAKIIRDTCEISECNCRLCTLLPDRCRSFVCPAETAVLSRKLSMQPTDSMPKIAEHFVATVSASLQAGTGLKHVISPIGKGAVPSSWKCLACNRTLNQSEWARCVMQERTLFHHGLGTRQEADELLLKCFIHREHYLICETYLRFASEIGTQLEEQADALDVDRAKLAHGLWTSVVDCVDTIAPRAMNARVDLRIRLAKSLVLWGISDEAKSLYKSAAELSRVAFGDRNISPTTAWLEEQALL